MKKIFLPLLAITILVTVIFHSCKKEKSCEGCRETNKPPIAVAGPDQVITLPTDSISLDGSASNDPDGTISSYLWEKISGPASFIIVNAASVKTIVRNLDTGIYRFELKVTDDEGFSAKDTVQMTVDAIVQTNHPPVANAGFDTTITLPANAINLDGSRSSDPDNNITSYLWTKISGPASFIISNANASQTQAINLVEGLYQFELKVTDASGLFSKDTMQVNVNAQQPPLPTSDNSCPPTNRPIVSPQVMTVGNLSIARVGIATVVADNKIFFAGGSSITGVTSRVDIYDLGSQTWSTAELSIPRSDVAGVASGDRIFFAGGFENSNNPSRRVDIYDLTTGNWSIAELSQPRYEIVTATVGNKVLFAGGRNSYGYGIGPNVVSDRIDIYEVSTNIWSTANLSEFRIGFTATTAGSKVYFAGGWSSNSGSYTSGKIDIYDDVTGIWSTSLLNTPKGFHASIFEGGKIYWAGGETYIDDPWSGSNVYTCQVEIRDISSQTTTLMNLSIPSDYINGGRVFKSGNKICFVSHRAYAYSWHLDIYDVSANEWSIGLLNLQASFWQGSFISHDNTIYVAGGVQSNGMGGSIYDSRVWKLDF